MKKIASIIFISSLIITNFVYADNKTDLQSSITTLETKISNYKTDLNSNLTTKITTISNNLNTFLATYDPKSIDYLVSLWKLNSNFKQDLINDLNTLTNEINSNFQTNVNSLNNIKNNINLSVSIVDTEKNVYSNSIWDIDNSINTLSWTINSQITTLTNKYNSSLESYKENFKSVYSSNSSTLSWIINFDKKFQEIFKINSEFESNYKIFNDTFLAFAWELKNFSTEKQKYYVDELTKELNSIKDKNILANPTLENYTSDLDRLIEILLENFKNSLKNYVDENYNTVFWVENIDWVKLKLNSVKNKYYDSNWNIKPNDFLAYSWAIDEVNYLYTSLNDVNNQVKTLIWTWWTESLTFDNLKIRLNNIIVRFWNRNYDNYKTDLLWKLKEKINLINQETKTTIAFIDNIDIRYNILSDKINKSTDAEMVKNEIEKFKNDTKKYSNLQSEVITKKLNIINQNLDIYQIKVELKQGKYKFLNTTKYQVALKDFFPKFEKKFSSSYKERLNNFVKVIDVKLSWNIKDSTRFMLLNVKLETLNFLSTK